jgi:LPXTG-motif cell wall-anchored protein
LKTDNGAFVLVKDTKPVYTYSIYNSDVTIVVDYWMILDDDAIVDEPGNKNFAQYGWNPVENEDENGNPKTPDSPSDTDKPSQKEEVDEATVYTYALAWVKTDEKGNQLAGAKFQLPFYVKETKDGNTYVYAGENPADKTGLTNELTTTAADAVITIKGVKQGTYSITETEAPEGYNKLTEPFDVEAKKTGEGETTKTKTTIYLDAKGNVTETVTSTTKEYNTDTDSFNNASATGDEEKSVPVYQFNPIVNQKGTELPSTGGIGTTIFYVMGSILVICAGVVLVTRRRMAA